MFGALVLSEFQHSLGTALFALKAENYRIPATAGIPFNRFAGYDVHASDPGVNTCRRIFSVTPIDLHIPLVHEISATVGAADEKLSKRIFRNRSLFL